MSGVGNETRFVTLSAGPRPTHAGCRRTAPLISSIASRASSIDPRAQDRFTSNVGIESTTPLVPDGARFAETTV
jgi:hypothetical protein